MSEVFRRTRASGPVVMILVLGFLAISLLHLLLTIWSSETVYELSDLKREKYEIDKTSQILSREVASLSSQQNLMTTASKLGMVANSNPVFLRLSDEKILGKPTPASHASSQSRNLVANSAMIKVSSKGKKASPASQKEPEKVSDSAPKVLTEIPASPTR
jgi:hypothetical protein